MTRWRMWCVESRRGGVIEFRVFEAEHQAKGYCDDLKASGCRAHYWEL